MSYQATGQNFPGGWPGFPGGLPGPIQTHPGPAGPNVPASIFPTHTRQGDVVNIVGPFGGFGQGQVRVRFQGSGWLYPQIMGPTAASVVVPQDAETGLCEVEMNGRRIFGTNCVIEKGQVRVGQKSHGRDTRAWNWAGGELVKVQGLGTAPMLPPDYYQKKEKSALHPYRGAIEVMAAVAAGVALYGWYSKNKTLKHIGLAAGLALIPLSLSAER